VEWLPATHHAIVLNPHLDHTSATVSAGTSSLSDSFTGFGGEVGYRYYTGTRGPTGFFVGPSLLVAHYTASDDEPSGKTSTSFSSIGGAVDVGGQWMIGPGVVVGFGFGLQYLKSTADNASGSLPLAASIITGSGVRPRALLTVGYAF
jgi:hypothetical protein